MRDKIDRKSQEQGFSESRLPVFTDEQKILVANSSGSSNKNDISKDFEFSKFFKKYFHQYFNTLLVESLLSIDFLGINFYTSEMVYPIDEGIDEVSYHKDDDAELYQDPSWFMTGSANKRVTPWGLRSTLAWIKSHYPGVDVYITENGVSDKVNLLHVKFNQ